MTNWGRCSYLSNVGTIIHLKTYSPTDTRGKSGHVAQKTQPQDLSIDPRGEIMLGTQLIVVQVGVLAGNLHTRSTSKYGTHANSNRVSSIHSLPWQGKVPHPGRSGTKSGLKNQNCTPSTLGTAMTSRSPQKKLNGYSLKEFGSSSGRGCLRLDTKTHHEG